MPPAFAGRVGLGDIFWEYSSGGSSGQIERLTRSECYGVPYLRPGPVSWCVLAGLGFPLELVRAFFPVQPEAFPLKILVKGK